MNRRAIDALMVSCVLLTCCSDAIEREVFCERMAQAICSRLFDEGCNAENLAGELRYTDQGDCEAAEGKVCSVLAATDELSFDRAIAFDCVDRVESAACNSVIRGDFHACDSVFTELVRPTRAIDAGTD